MKYLSFLILIATISFYGCEEKEKPYIPVQLCSDMTNNIDSINKYIHGTWKWVEEKRYNRITREYEYATPKDYGYNLTQIFSGDTLKFFKNTTPDSVYQFKIQRELEISNIPTDSTTVVAYYSFYTMQSRGYVAIMICKNQLLMLHDTYRDGIGRTLWMRD